MSTLSEIGDFLETVGIASDAGTGAHGSPKLYVGSMGDYPDEALCVYAYAGGPPEYVQESFSPSTETPQIQVVTRAVRDEDAEALCMLAWKALAPVTNATLGTTKYLSIRPNHSPAFLKRDSNDRVLYFFNATVKKEVSVAVLS